MEGPLPASGLSVSRGAVASGEAPSLPSEPSLSTPSYTVQGVLPGQSPPLTALCLYAGFTPKRGVQPPPTVGLLWKTGRPRAGELTSVREAARKMALCQAPTSSSQQGAAYLQIWALMAPILAIPIGPFQRLLRSHHL